MGNDKITLRGPADGNISISSGNTGNNIQIKSQGDATFENLTFADSNTRNNSMISNEGTLTLNNCYIHNNSSYRSGGGGIFNKGYLNLNTTMVSGNTVSESGGGVYNLFGTVNVNNSQITHNYAYNNGGGIYSLGGHVALLGSHITSNTAEDNFGGGVDVINSSLDISSNSEISENISDYYGGGIAVQGSVASISDSALHNNTAHLKGGGIVVTKNTDNNFSSLVMLRGMTITDKPYVRHYIGQNTDSGEGNKDVTGNLTTVGATLQISDDDTVGSAGNPPPPSWKSPPESTPNFLIFVNVDKFCLDKDYSYGELSNQGDISFTCFTLSQERSEVFSGQAICQTLYPVSSGMSVIDRMANYFDPTSLQCYKNLKRLGPIGKDSKDFDDYCKQVSQYTGLYENKSERTTAYDWLCQPKDKTRLPSSLDVASACNTKYHTSNAIDRLINYNRPDGWECWVPA